ncbi:MAG: nitrate/nitrite transporter NrtS [Actinomycetota bacterium]
MPSASTRRRRTASRPTTSSRARWAATFTRERSPIRQTDELPKEAAHEGASPPRLFSVVFSRPALSRCIPIALFVGTVLSLVNQGSVIFGGTATGVTWLRVATNFFVPFCVSSSGFFASQRASWRAA